MIVEESTNLGKMTSFTWNPNIKRFVCDEDKSIVLTRKQADMYRRKEKSKLNRN